MFSRLQDRGTPSMLAREVAAHPARFSQVYSLSLRRVPLLYTATALAAGIATSAAMRPAALLVCATAALLVVGAIALRFAPRVAAPAVLLAWFVLGWALGTLHPRAVPNRALQQYTDGVRRDITATVVALRPLPALDTRDDDPAHPWEVVSETEDPAHATAYAADLKLRSIEHLNPDVSTMDPVTGTVRVTLPAADAESLHCGAAVNATLRLFPPREFRDPGVWNYRGWLAEQNIAATGVVVPRHLSVGPAGTAPLLCRTEAARTWASARLDRFVDWQHRLHLPRILRWSDADATAWSAMLFGDRTALTQSLRTDFERTGTFHLFVVSGMHVAIVAGLVLWLAIRLRLPRAVAALAAALVTTTYAVFTGFGEPVQRALFMTLIFLLTFALARERNAMNAIGAAVLAMLLLRPQALRDAGFQMTVLIAVTIAGIAVPLLDRTIAPYARACHNLSALRLDRRLPPHVAQFRVLLRWWVELTRATLGRPVAAVLLLAVRGGFLLLTATVIALITEMTMALPMGLYFHRVTLLALPANLLVVPLLLPLMVCGVAAFLLCLVAYPLALVAAVPAALLLHATTAVIHGLAHLHRADVRTPGPTTLTAAVIASGIAAAVVLLRARPRALAWAGAALAPAVALGTVLLSRQPVTPHALAVTAIDVGQGDSILLDAPDGAAMLIDAGGTPGVESRGRADAFDIGEQVVSPFLWRQGVHQLDVLALTHAHMDHLGGMLAVLHNFRPRELWLSVDVPSPHLVALLQAAAQQNVSVRYLRAGTNLTWHAIDLSVLGPATGYQPADAPTNDDSLVLLARYGNASALLAGDAEAPEEQTILAAHPLPVTLLKVGHHGSLSSSTPAFLDAVHPRFAVISCGRGNHFGHPREPVLARLEEHNALTARTDTMGAVVYTLQRDGTASVAFPSTEP